MSCSGSDASKPGRFPSSSTLSTGTTIVSPFVEYGATHPAVAGGQLSQAGQPLFRHFRSLSIDLRARRAFTWTLHPTGTYTKVGVRVESRRRPALGLAGRGDADAVRRPAQVPPFGGMRARAFRVRCGLELLATADCAAEDTRWRLTTDHAGDRSTVAESFGSILRDGPGVAARRCRLPVPSLLSKRAPLPRWLKL